MASSGWRASWFAGAVLLAGCSAGGGPTAAPSAEDTGRASLTGGFGESASVVYTSNGLVRTAAADGSGATAVAAFIGTGEQLHPDWSPDGASIVFAVDDEDGTRDIWTAARDGSAHRIVDCAPPCAFTDDPAWSPDGTRIAFHRGVGGEGGVGSATLETVDINGSAPHVVVKTKRARYAFEPRWSPDGSHLVVELVTFASARIDEERITSTQLAIIDNSSGDLTMLTEADLKAGSPDWNSTGDRILFVAPPDPTKRFTEVYTIAATGGAITQLTHAAKDGTRALLASWSPDGGEVIFDHETTLDDPATAMISTIPETGGDATPLFLGTHARLRPADR